MVLKSLLFFVKKDSYITSGFLSCLILSCVPRVKSYLKKTNILGNITNLGNKFPIWEMFPTWEMLIFISQVGNIPQLGNISQLGNFLVEFPNWEIYFPNG